MGKQTTAIEAGAPINEIHEWNSIYWKAAWKQVRRLQMRIAKAVQENRWNKVKSLQYLLTHSFYAKLLAVKRVLRQRFCKISLHQQQWQIPMRNLTASPKVSRSMEKVLRLDHNLFTSGQEAVQSTTALVNKL